MRELQVQRLPPQPAKPGRAVTRPLRLVLAAFVALVGMGSAWNAWALKQQETCRTGHRTGPS